MEEVILKKRNKSSGEKKIKKSDRTKTKKKQVKIRRKIKEK